MLQGGSVLEDDLSISNMAAIARDFSLQDVDYSVVQDAVDLLCEIYLVKTNETVHFQHKIVLETVFHIFGDMFPSRLIHSCRIDVLCQYLRIDSVETSSDDSSAPVFALSRTVWFDWINRVLLEIRLGNVTQVISHETMYDNFFAVEFVTELLISDQRQFAEKIFLAACEMDSYLVVRHLLRHILKRRSRLTTGLGLTESLVLEGFTLASQVESFNVIRVILDKYHTLSLKRISKALHEACNMGNPKSVDAILQQRKEIPVGDISQALFKACRCLGRPTSKQGEHTCKVILRHRKDIQTDQVVHSFQEACKRGRGGTAHVFLLEVPSLTSQHVFLGLLDAARTTRNFKGGDSLKCLKTLLLTRDDLTTEMVTSAYVEACGTWRSELVRLFLRLRGDLSDENVVKGLIMAANKGQCESISIIHDERPNISLHLVKEGLNESCRCGRNETCNFFLNLWPELEKEYLHESLCEAVRAGQDKTVRMILHQRKNISSAHVTDALAEACRFDKKSTVRAILRERPDLTSPQLSCGVAIACLTGEADIVKLIFKIRADLTKADVTRFLSSSTAGRDNYIYISNCLNIMLQQKDFWKGFTKNINVQLLKQIEKNKCKFSTQFMIHFSFCFMFMYYVQMKNFIKWYPFVCSYWYIFCISYDKVIVKYIVIQNTKNTFAKIDLYIIFKLDWTEKMEHICE